MDRSTRSMLMAGAAVAATLSLTLASVAAEEDAAEGESMDKMEAGLFVRDAWTRELPMLDLAGAAYMVIHNSTDADDALVGVTSPAAAVVELHLSSMDDEGMMSMNQVADIPVAAHADAVLEPGGYHLMLIDLVEPLAEGAEVELTLEFMTAEPQTLMAPVMAGAPMMEDMDMSHGDDDGMSDMSDDDMDMGEASEEDEG